MRTAALLLFAVCALQAENSTRPGRFHVEHPTLLNLGFEWALEGDANRNAGVAVRFRKVGTAAWRSRCCVSVGNGSTATNTKMGNRGQSPISRVLDRRAEKAACLFEPCATRFFSSVSC